MTFNEFFKLEESKTTLRREALAGLTTFATMAYIIFVQPVVFHNAGMDRDAVFTSTCLITAFSTILMALLSNYPFAVAPAMGHNFYFAFLVTELKIPWPTALGAVFISGIIFVATASFGFREQIVAAVPESLKSSIAAGIGLLIALIGLEWAGIVRLDTSTFVALGNLRSAPAIVALIGLTVTVILMARKIGGAILLGILAATAAGLLMGVIKPPSAIVSLPPSIAPIALKLDVVAAITQGLFAIIFIFFFLDLFDTVGSLIGVAKQAGLMKDGRLPRAGRALLADALGTTGSALVGNTTMVSYVESASGVAAGGRTGVTALAVAALFTVALFFSPLVSAISGGVTVNEPILLYGQEIARRDFTLYPITAPALIVVGSLMIRAVRDIKWDDFTESLPAFLTLVLTPLTFSITDGISFGFISYALLKLVTNRAREAHWLVYLFAALFVLRYSVPGLH